MPNKHSNGWEEMGDPDRITIAGASAGAGLASVLSSLSTVAHDIDGIRTEQ